MFHDVPSFRKYEWSHPDVFLYQKVLQPFTPHNVVPPIYRLVYTHELVPYIYSIRSLVFLEIDLHQLSFFDLGHSPSLPVPWFHPIPSHLDLCLPLLRRLQRLLRVLLLALRHVHGGLVAGEDLVLAVALAPGLLDAHFGDLGAGDVSPLSVGLSYIYIL